jgi:1,2-dihydroxy-3-keto-5-methylthiopentene dioxygenase
MRAYWLEEAKPEGGAPIDAPTLAQHGVTYRAIPVEGHEGALDGFMRANGYVTRDEVRLSPETPGLPAILGKFDREHLHTDDEVRYVLEGAGIFDIRSLDDRWMRVVVEQGDLISVPKDRHHRFMLTEASTIRCARLFVDAAGWVPHYR